MSKRKIYTYSVLMIIIIFLWMVLNPDAEDDDFPARVKISLRAVGNELLLADRDATSLVLPVVVLESSKYRLSFERPLSMLPDSLVSIVQRNLRKSDLSENYRVEVTQCTDGEVAYSYEIRLDKEKTIIPCSERFLPEKCYTIDIRFLNRTGFFSSQSFLLLSFFLILTLILLEFLFQRRRQKSIFVNNNGTYTKIGSFQFYPDQNKLIKEAVEISLSKKECELLALFVDRPNQIIKRDELTKKVWEDHGVFVGRSLDTYISKLRKKLHADTRIKLTNVHGVGYKLEVHS